MKRLFLPLFLMVAAWALAPDPTAAQEPAGAKRDLTTAERETELLEKLNFYFDGINYAGGTKEEVKGTWSTKASEIHKLLREYARYRFRHPDDPGPAPPAKKKSAALSPRPADRSVLVRTTRAANCGCRPLRPRR